MLPGLREAQGIVVQVRSMQTSLVLRQGTHPQGFSDEARFTDRGAGMPAKGLDARKPQSQMQRLQHGSTFGSAGLGVVCRLSSVPPVNHAQRASDTTKR